jgi:predicted amidophosphoribosyltransferase
VDGVLLDLVLPRRCVVCRRSGVDLCTACLSAVERIRPPLCERCGAPVQWPVRRCTECAGRRLAFATARAAVAYDEAVRALVSAWKEHGLRRLAGPAADLVAEVVPPPRVDVLVPVPPDADRALARGHHPAAALAVELGERWDLPVERLVVRTRRTPRQRGLALAERRRNVARTFAAVRAPPRIGLVDDVYTTGSTVTAAASALRRAGARRVEAVTFARAVRGYTVRALARPPPAIPPE